MSGKWHVEHEDGRKWTTNELAMAYRSFQSYFVLNECGSLGVLYTDRDCFETQGNVMAYDWDGPAMNVRDMVVVWDE